MLLHILPLSLQAWVKTQWPEYFLPPSVILKREKAGWREEFDNETKAYEMLRPLQGDVIPVCYGVALCHRDDWDDETGRALILSDVGGTVLDSSDCPKLEPDELREMLRVSYRRMADFGIINDDNKVHNHHIVGNRIVVLDLEQTDSPEPHEVDKAIELAVDDIIYFWNRRQRALAEEKDWL